MAIVPTLEMAPDRDDGEIEQDLRRDLGNAVIRIRILRVPESDKFPEGVKYTFHYGEKGSDDPIARYDNHHGVHERHEGNTVEEIEYPGTEALLRRFIDEPPVDL